MKFIDTVRIFVKGGRGGNGCLSFLREKFRAFGGPNGGDGGRGADIVLVASGQLTTLLDFTYRPHIKGKDGENGRGKDQTGASAENEEVLVPLGTVVYRDGAVVADLSQPGDRYIAARGGRGGRGNASFKTQKNTAPRIYEKGEPGEETELELELKLLADVGFVGFPNAGKSTMLSRLSNARPKVADYPFTTLVPNLGIASYKGKSFVIADIPGLIEGAHAGKGLGGEFLRHVERTRILVHLVDPMGFDGVPAEKGVRLIEEELKRHSPALARKPRVLAVNKNDLPESEEGLKRVRSRYRKRKIFGVSGATGDGLTPLLNEVIRELAKQPAEPAARETAPVTRKVKVDRGFRIERARGGAFRIRGKYVERIAAMADFSLMESVYRLQSTLKRIGVDKALRSAGVRPGDVVMIGQSEFEWSDQERQKLPRLPRGRKVKRPQQ